jgi:hypothetical protein
MGGACSMNGEKAYRLLVKKARGKDNARKTKT